jgi:hypothetical protein
MAHQAPPKGKLPVPAPEGFKQMSEEARRALADFVIPPEEFGSMIDNAEYRDEYLSRLW